ncbi:dTDP-4-dehydrorhamnose 3,5-epimerase [Longibacter salinarum]|uniref:dTDP-4-dehydrorhamnose 3,5-epimerase n=1 Tax=Longibacter salinarum TaxID=1850348 RepID=A0A2A8D133_9BACT|nr:dTDP-4-dehydrorhamnose 3,5-epimerase [Longibacter salinarum]PEN14513.1 dTDP-4-dehydrorhamnose 3,5-epimerase [Longibacter salinarum]
MTVEETALPGVLHIQTDVYEDERGAFMETFHAERYAEAGIDATFVQDNVSRSEEGVLRGLHLQNPHPQGKLVYVLQGTVYDVVVDVRPSSNTFGEWMGTTLDAWSGQLYVPEGFAHGFVVTEGPALFAYKCTDVYDPNAELSVLWNDPDLDIEWPVDTPIVSGKDAAAPRLRDIDPDRLMLAESVQ